MSLITVRVTADGSIYILETQRLMGWVDKGEESPWVSLCDGAACYQSFYGVTRTEAIDVLRAHYRKVHT